MEERFELKKDGVKRVKQALTHVFEEENRILFAYLHGSFGVFFSVMILISGGSHEQYMQSSSRPDNGSGSERLS